MKELIANVAEIRPAIDLTQILHEWDLLDGREQRTLAEFRAAKAKLLIKARGGFNKRGDGFKEFVEGKLRVPFRTAERWMESAGYKPPRERGTGDDHGQNGHDSPANSAVGLADMERCPTREDHDHGEVPATVSASRGPVASESWAEEVERLVESMRRSAQSLFSGAEKLDALCEQHNASLMSPALMTMHSMLVAAKSCIQRTLRLMGKEA